MQVPSGGVTCGTRCARNTASLTQGRGFSDGGDNFDKLDEETYGRKRNGTKKRSKL